MELRGHTAVLTLSNPPANTRTRQSLSALKRLLADLSANREIYSLAVIGLVEKLDARGAGACDA